MLQLGLFVLIVFLGFDTARSAEPPHPVVSVSGDRLTYHASENGDRLPDFSYCGYGQGVETLPDVAGRIRLDPSGVDDTGRIQTAIDYVASLTADERGWRGAVELGPGQFQVAGSIKISGTGVVLRGAGIAATTVLATGKSRRTLLQLGQVKATANKENQADAAGEALNLRKIVAYVPVGSRTLSVDRAAGLQVGQRVLIEHVATAEWIAAVGMNSFPSDDGRGSWLDWKPGTITHAWEREILSIDGNSVQLDVPLTASLNPELTTATLQIVAPDSRSRQLGVEYLTLVSQADIGSNPKDEEHAWDAIHIDAVEDAWVRAVCCRQFVGSAVSVGDSALQVTVVDCQSLDPVSENGGWRRHSFTTRGQQSLFLRCRAVDGRHDFSVGALTPGPNAFVYCQSQNSLSFSGPLGSWATGVLYDNVEIDGAGLALTNRETASQGTGWAAANCVLWNCVAPSITCRKPPTANNWAIGVWGETVGDGTWRELNSFTTPDSLYAAQLAQRIGDSQTELVMRPSLIPSLTSAASQALDQAPTGLPISEPAAAVSVEKNDNRLHLHNGWLMVGDRLAIGRRMSLSWWRGSVLPEKVAEFGPGITRFVPGREEMFYTDPIAEVVSQMKQSGQVALEHHWGLWYDRRRDDHQMIRRIDGDVWPPFYELPWARSGIGQAWDGLSRYDLTRFNTWYFDRLREFAEQADASGLVLLQYMYFQHNVLEAGAHWADFPWRPANCIQDTGFTEPPVYENRKRIYMAEDFYDISHPLRRELHTQYIRHCLNTLGRNSNVLFVLGEEFTGPAHFVRFWLDTIRQWELTEGRNVLVVLSATHDVQSEILGDPKYAESIDVIDLKYWWYTGQGEIYNPPAGNLAPRQQLRDWKGSKGRSPQSLARAVVELRQRFPQKAVISSIGGEDPWLHLSAGGSLPALPPSTEDQLLREVSRTNPLMQGQVFSLQLAQQPWLSVSMEQTNSVQEAAFAARSVLLDRTTGRATMAQQHPSGQVPSVRWTKSQ